MALDHQIQQLPYRVLDARSLFGSRRLRVIQTGEMYASQSLDCSWPDGRPMVECRSERSVGVNNLGHRFILRVPMKRPPPRNSLVIAVRADRSRLEDHLRNCADYHAIR